jgi:hypothetical protein
MQSHKHLDEAEPTLMILPSESLAGSGFEDEEPDPNFIEDSIVGVAATQGEE